MYRVVKFGVGVAAAVALACNNARPTEVAPPGSVPPQAPALPGAAATSSNDRVNTADQTSNTVSVIDAGTNALLGTIPLGDPRPQVLGPLYNKQIDVHGLGFSPDGTLLGVISVTSNSVTIIETATSKVRRQLYVGRAPHEGTFSPSGREL